MDNRVLILLDYYLPGFKAGGPIRSVENIVNSLSPEKSFTVFTNDRDHGDDAPYSSVDTKEPQQQGACKVHYLSPRRRRFFSLLKRIRAERPTLIYLNSAFSFYFTIQVLIARRLGLLGSVKVVISPRGEFSSGALKLKSFKKRAYLMVAKLIGLYQQVYWKASSFKEEADIRRIMGLQSVVAVASDVTTEGFDFVPKPRNKQQGSLRIIFLSRIARMKNLVFVLQSLQELQGDVTLDIYGPIEDSGYWANCQFLMKVLSEQMNVAYKGSIKHEDIPKVLSQYDLFYLPTLGENFGHVIFEALSAGCPILISDNTQWSNLQKEGLGWSLSLEDMDAFKRVLQECVDMDSDTHAAYVKRAYQYAKNYSRDPMILQSNRILLSTEDVKECAY